MTSKRVWLVLTVAVGLLVVAVAITDVQVTWRYRPAPESTALLTDGSRWSRTIVRRHEVAIRLLASVGFLWFGLTGWLALRRAPRRFGVAGAAVAAYVAMLVTSVAWSIVKWDQLALWAVTVGLNAQGLWYAAFSDQVRFVLIGCVEVSQAAYRDWVVVHLLAPWVALAGVVATAGMVAKRPAILEE